MKILYLIAAPLALATAAHAAEPTSNGDALFAKLDANGDGKIDKAELTKAHEAKAAEKGDKTPVDTAKIDEMIKRVDTNGDGAVDKAEMSAIRKAPAGAEEKR
ncbi:MULTISPECIES: EF-hand domain-containing protein [unclassified Sphingopyxis]|uniref:EF-hand domain-containing protein n=1 Tax=unclassified Sphingopyxis TaxID=2614943 RepID=UPI000A476393|nr:MULTISPECIES: EF-hand domain-containing protein [unclassified Sphingopyxis]